MHYTKSDSNDLDVSFEHKSYYTVHCIYSTYVPFSTYNWLRQAERNSSEKNHYIDQTIIYVNIYVQCAHGYSSHSSVHWFDYLEQKNVEVATIVDRERLCPIYRFFHAGYKVSKLIEECTATRFSIAEAWIMKYMVNRSGLRH
jgi:hypothetical protein